MQCGGGAGAGKRFTLTDTADRRRSGRSGGSRGFLRGPLAFRFSFLRLVLAEAAHIPGGLSTKVTYF